MITRGGTGGLDEGDLLTLSIAALSAVFALGSMIVAIIATMQTRKYHPRPYLQIDGLGWASELGGPGYLLSVRNVSGIDAHDLSLEFKLPRRRGWKYASMNPALDAHSEWSLNFNLAAPGIPGMVWLVPKPDHTGKPPIFGVWRWRLTWRSSPNPLRRASRIHRHWVTQRRYAAGDYTSVG